VFFANIGGAHFGTTTDPGRVGQPYKWFSRDPEIYTPVVSYEALNLVQVQPVLGEPTVVDGLRLVDARASYGVGLETFALGFPIHFDWSWKTLFNKQWEDLRFAAFGGSAAFRQPKFTVWIGYDF
jgi:hypothetical protein